MNRLIAAWLVGFAVVAAESAMQAAAQEAAPLRLVQTIPMPKVKGRIDHMDADVKGKRLFVAALENGSLEVVDLKAGIWVRTIPGFKKPQGVLYVPSVRKLFVASGDDGMLRIFRGDTLDLLSSVQLDLGPNRVTYDPSAKHVYVGFGGKDAGKDYGQVGIIDVADHRHLADVNVAAHPAEILIDGSGQTLFVSSPRADKVQIIDVKKKTVLSTWPTKSGSPTSMALDHDRRRLFVGGHKPPELIVYDTQSGKEVVSVPTVEGLDGVYFDASNRRIYVSGGRDEGVGFVYVHQQRDADHYDLIAKVPTRAGAGTSVWIPELNRYYVAAPADGKEDAAILVFEPQR